MFDSSYFRDISNLENDGTQNYLVFQSVSGCFQTIANTNKVTTWKLKELPNESIEPPSTSDNSLNPRINYTDNAKTWVTFVGGCLKQLLKNKWWIFILFMG